MELPVDRLTLISKNRLRELLDKEKRYEKIIRKVIETTHDDDTHEFLNRVLEGKENDAPSYRIKLDNNLP